MEQSQSIKELASALTKFQAEVETIKKDANNPFFKSKYASLENIVEGIRAPLKKAELSFSQFPTGENELTTILMHTSGEYLKATVKMSPKDNTPQGQGSAITYMRRYALSAVLGIVTDEDDDGNAASAPKVQVPKSAPKSAPKEPEKKKGPSPVLILKNRINLLVKELGIPGMNKENAKDIIHSLVGLDLVEENYKDIAARLQTLADEQNDIKGKIEKIK